MKKNIPINIRNYALLILIMDIVGFLIVRFISEAVIVVIVLQLLFVLIFYLYYQGKVYDDIKRNSEDTLKRLGLVFKYSLWSWRLIKIPSNGDERIRKWKCEILIYNIMYALIIPNIYMMLVLFYS